MHSYQDCFGTYQAPHSLDTKGFISWRVTWSDMKLTTHLHLVSRWSCIPTLPYMFYSKVFKCSNNSLPLVITAANKHFENLLE